MRQLTEDGTGGGSRQGAARLQTYEALDGFGVRRLQGERGGAPKVICFPFLGGQSLAYKRLAELLPATWEVLSLDPPGHGWARGAPLRDIEQMVERYLRGMARMFEAPVHLFGHSMGGIVAYRLAQRLERAGTPARTLMVSGAPLPHRVKEYAYLAHFDNQALFEALDTVGTMPGGLAKSTWFHELVMPTLRADLEALVGHRPDLSAPLDTPVHVLYSEEDPFVPSQAMHEWRRYGRAVRFEVTTGHHLYPVADPEATARWVQRIVETSLEPSLVR